MENKTSKLLEHRRVLKKRKPKFIRQESHKVSSLGMGRKKKQKWRRAKGRHSKIRQAKKGRRTMPTIGYSSPRLVRGTIEGKKPIIVNNINELLKVGKTNIAIIASVGLKKKIEIMNKAKEMKINVLNLSQKILDKKIKDREEQKKSEREKEEQKKKIHAAKDQEKAKEKEREKDEVEEKKIIATQEVEEKRHDDHVRTKESKVIKRVAIEK